MKLIAFILFICANEVISSKLPLVLLPVEENTSDVLDNSSTTQKSNTDTLNARDVGTDYGSYIPTDYGNLNFLSNWVNNISRLLPTYTTPQPFYNTQTYPFSTDYSQEQWSSQYWPNDWNQHTNSYPHQQLYPNTPDVSQFVGTQNPNYFADQYQPQPALTKKISTVFNTGDSQEIKHKVIISPEYPDGTGYISVGASGANKIPGSSSKDGKVYYRF